MIPANQVSNPHQNKRRSLLRRIAWFRSGCVLCRMECHAPALLPRLPEPLHAGLYRMPSLYGFARELHSFVHRMAAICKLRYRAYLIYMGPLEQGPAGHREPNTRTCACIEDTRKFVSAHPWATFLDLEMYRDAWQAGAKWGENISCKQEREESPCNPPDCNSIPDSFGAEGRV